MNEEPKKQHDLFSKPPPDLLDEIDEAAADARKAADEARVAGQKAADEVMKSLRKLFMKMANDITEELGEGKK